MIAPAVSSAYGSRIALALAASGGDCDWKTIAGTHVCIGGDGKIAKGPAALVGRTPGGGEVGPAKAGGGRGRYVVRGGHHVFEHETYAGPETAGNRLRPGDKSEMAGDWGDAKKGDKVEVVTTTQEGGRDRAVVRTDDGREHVVQPSMVKPVRAHGDEMQAAPGTRAPAEVVAAEAKHGAAPAFKPLAAHDYRDGGFSDFPAEHEGLSRLAYADPDKAASLVADGKAEEVGNSETDKYSGGKMIRLSEGVDPEEAGAPALPHDQQGMQAVHETLDAPKVQIPIRPGGKQIVAKQLNGEVYSTYDQKTGEYGLTTAGELDALRERFAGEHPDVIAKLAEARQKKGLSASAAAPSRVALLLSATAETDDDWGDATDEEADGYDPEICELPSGVVAELSAARPASRILLSLNCGTGAGGFAVGNTCGKGRYGRSEGVRTSRTTLGNIRKAGAVKTKEFTDSAGRRVEEHTTPDGRTFHAVTHASGRRSFHQIDGPARVKAAAGGQDPKADAKMLADRYEDPVSYAQRRRAQVLADNGTDPAVKAAGGKAAALAHVDKVIEHLGGKPAPAASPAPAATPGAFARYRTPEGHDVRVGASGRIVAGDAKAVGLMGKRPEDVGAVPEAEYYAKQAAGKVATPAVISRPGLPSIHVTPEMRRAAMASASRTPSREAAAKVGARFGGKTPNKPSPAAAGEAYRNAVASAGARDAARKAVASTAAKASAARVETATAAVRSHLSRLDTDPASHSSAEIDKTAAAVRALPRDEANAVLQSLGIAGKAASATEAARKVSGVLSSQAEAAGRVQTMAAQRSESFSDGPAAGSAKSVQVGDRVTLPQYTGAPGGGKNYGNVRDAEVTHVTDKFVTVKVANDPDSAAMFGSHSQVKIPRSHLESAGIVKRKLSASAAAPASRVALALACAPTAGTVVLSLSAADQAARPPAVIEPPAGMPASIDGVPVTYGRRRIATARPFVHILTGQSLAIDRPRIAMWLSAFEKRKARGLYPFIYPRHLEKDEQPDARQTLGYVVGMDADGDDLYATEQYIGPDAARTAAANGRSVTIMADALDDAGDKYPEIMHHLAATPMPALPQTNHLPVLAASGAVVMAPVYVCGPGGCRCSSSRAELAAIV